MELLERFLHYVSFDTQSDPNSESFPSTAKQLTLLEQLANELREMGAESVEMDKYGYVMATIPASKGYESAPVIALLAHVDTSPDVSGSDIHPHIIESYTGGDILFSHVSLSHVPSSHEDSIRISDYPELNDLVGHTLITTDGRTLLGADDKAGVAIIMDLSQRLLSNREIATGKVRICFTPDEEIGRGVDFLDLQRLGADFAYTLDGGAEGEIEFENFNAAGAKISIKGHNHHPGAAKGHMRNALDIAHELHAMLPAAERPQYTADYEGFYHLTSLTGTVEQATMEYIIRDHSAIEFERRKVEMWSCVDMLQKRYGEESVTLTLKDQYLNMRSIVERHPEMIDMAEEAMHRAGVTPRRRPIRGGTDGARLSYMGLPCPNLFTGGGNFHSRHEYCSLTTMERSRDMLLNLVHLWATK